MLLCFLKNLIGLVKRDFFSFTLLKRQDKEMSIHSLIQPFSLEIQNKESLDICYVLR